LDKAIGQNERTCNAAFRDLAMDVQLQGYSFIEKLYEGSRTSVYRGLRDRDQRPVVVKCLKDPFPNYSELLRFGNQYSIAKDLDLPTVVKPLALLPHGNASALIMEDFGGCDLNRFLAQTQSAALGKSHSGLILFLQVVIQVAEALEGLYQQRIIHKDIKPANILIHPESHQVKLIDFSIASSLPRQLQEIQTLSALEGTLAYLSPEQTGRTNRGIDYRSDFYSLGVTCYELLTGQLPFVSDDPMDIVHAHLARQPVPPCELNPDFKAELKIPQMLSAIVLKLLAKNAEDRYQSAFGLKCDLARCLSELKQTGQISPFKLGLDDLCDRFLISEKLYGRQSEVAHLLAAFERVSQGNTEIMLVAGTPGIGKTAVINELHKPILRQRGYFVRGQHEALQQSALCAFIQAGRSLVRLLLSESEAQRQYWQQQILQALGQDAPALIAVIPELADILGSPIGDLPSDQPAENRLIDLMESFLRVFSSAQHPLVVFLDDLQWADAASLKLLQRLIQNTSYLLVIGAYCDHEDASSHAFKGALEEICEIQDLSSNVLSSNALSSNTFSSVNSTDNSRLEGDLPKRNALDLSQPHRHFHINLLALTPLSARDIHHLVADTLHSDLAQTKPLAELIYQKTGGNPFFAAQFLTALHAEGKIAFDAIARRWQYDLAQISADSLSEDVLAFVKLRLQKLPERAQTILQIAACMGSIFDLETLAAIASTPLAAIADDLDCALQAELILPDSAREAVYRFAHEQVQQAAYDLMNAEQQALRHLAMGRHLLAHSRQTLPAEQNFELVNQFNRGKALLTTEADRLELSELNLSAGRQSKATSAYAAALSYFFTGIDLLPPNHWQAHYDLTLEFHNELAKTAYLSGDLPTMQRHIDLVLQQAQSLLDKACVYETQIQAAISQNHLRSAVELTLAVLAQLGIDIPVQPQPADVQRALSAIATSLDRTDAIALPSMSDAEALVVTRLLSKAVSAAYLAAPEVLPLLVCTGVDRALALGNSPLSSFLYGWYGVLACGLTGDIDQGHQMGELALNLLKKMPDKESQTRVVTLVYFLIHPWKAHIRESLGPLQKSYQSAIAHGDSEYAAWSAAIYGHYAYLSGYPLEKLSDKIEGYRHSQLQQTAAFNCLDLYQQIALNLLGRSEMPAQLDGEAYSEAKMLPIHLAANDLSGLCHLYINKGILNYLFDHFVEAEASFNQALNYLPGINSSQWLPALLFYDSLSCLALPTQKQLPRIILNQEKLRTWARLAPMNHLHRWHLVEAERCRVGSDKAAAIDHYDQAIALAQASGFIQEEALAHELAARFYLLWGKGRIAQSHLIDAYYAYGRWGAKAKIADLEQRYPKLLELILKRPEKRPEQTLSSTDTILAYASTPTTHSNSSMSEVIDLTTLLHTSQILSREIQLDKLLAALLEAVIQNAGADKCVLLMPKADDWAIEAFSCLGKPPELLQSQPLKPGEQLPISLINQVRQSCKPAVIVNVTVHPTLAVDPYVLRYRPKSALCTPILNQGKLIAILYLENNLTIGAFSDRQLEVLNLICTQAAISLENARLYQQAQQALEELKTSHMQLVQSEKMSALGNLVAGVAHEINNPVNFLKGNLKPALNYVQDLFSVLDLVEDDQPREVILEEIEEINLDFIREDLPNLLHSMTFGISRIRDISTSLRTFSRSDQAHKTAFNLHEGLDSTLLILKHRFQASDRQEAIEVVKQYGDLPSIECFAGQLNQVFMNLLANAIDALEESQVPAATDRATDAPLPTGCITITTALVTRQTDERSDAVSISIADNGPGMDESVRSRVFDHLFTTKPVGKGTGLGLAISYAIVVEKHGGSLTVNSVRGKGTEFVITLPVAEKTAAA
jgi:predicted ATPase/signal transduction histidine kinase